MATFVFPKNTRFLTVLFLCLFLVPGEGRADFARDSSLTAELIRTARFPEAIHFVDSILTSTTGQEQLRQPAVLFMREQLAYAYDRLDLAENAFETAIAVIADAKEMGDFRTEVEARLTVALIREKHQLWENCKAELQRVGQLLRQHNLPASQARYFVRKASYHRFMGATDSLGLYARLAIRQGKEAGFTRAIADGMMLYTIAFPANKENKESIFTMMREAIQYTQEAGPYDTYIVMQRNLSVVMNNYGDYDEAKALNQRIVEEVEANASNGYINNGTKSGIYAERADNLYKEGRLDEAYHALNRANIFNEGHFEVRLQESAREIEAKYNVQQKDVEIRKHELEVERQVRLKNWIIGVLAFMLGLVGVLGYQTLRLNRTRSVQAAQAVTLNRVNDELESALEEQVTLRAELHHRVKNNLQVIISLLNLQENRETDFNVKSSLRSTSERVFSIAAVHELLFPKQSLDRLVFLTYLDKLCQHSAQMWPAESKPVFAMDVGNKTFNLDTLIPLGMIFSELLTNTRKNFPSGKGQPLITTGLQKEKNGSFTLCYQDNGPGYANESLQERSGGLGSYLIRSMARQLNGTVSTYNDGGAVTEVNFWPKNASSRGGFAIQDKKVSTREIPAAS